MIPDYDSMSVHVPPRILIVRIAGRFLIPVVLLLIACRIVIYGNGWMTHWDGIYGITVMLMLGIHWYDCRTGLTFSYEGPPYSSRYVRMCISTALTVALVVWVLANLLGNYAITGLR